MGILQPLDDLVPALRLGGRPHDGAVCLKHLCPELDLVLGRLVCPKSGAPPVREPLQSGAFGGCQPADDVLRLGLVHHRRVLIVPRHQSWGLFFKRLGVSAGGHAVSHRMAVGSVQGKGHILIHAAALGTVLVRPANHGTLQGHHSHTALVAGGIASVRIQASGSFRFVEAALRILGFHGVAVLGADAIHFDSQFITPGLAHIAGIQRVRHIGGFPLLSFIGSVGTGTFHERHEHRLVVVAAQRGGLVILDQRAFAAALTAGADLQRLRRLHYKGLVVPAHAVGGVDRGRCFQRSGVSGVLAMVLIDRRRHRACAEGGRGFLLIPDAPCLCGMLGTKACRPHHAGRVPMVFRPERCRNILRHIHAAAALVV